VQTGVYEIVHTESGRRYVGSAVNFDGRWKAHRFHLARGTHHSRYLQSCWSKHGADAFAFRKTIICEPKDLLLYEQIAMDSLGPEFNTAKVAGSCLGLKHSAETKAKLSASKMGNTHTRGRSVHTPASRAKLAEAKMGNTHTKGKPRDPAAVAKTAAAHRGMKRSEETKRRISEAMTGKRHALPRSAETCAKLSAVMKARPRDPVAIAKMAATKRGSTLNEQHKARIGAASRAAWAKRKQVA
jgi:hypothetical protein